MLVIRDAQVATLRQARSDAFERRVEALLRAHLPEWRDAPEGTIRQLITAARARAARHAIFQPGDLERFILYAGRYGADFGETPETGWAWSIIEDRSMLGRQKLDALDALGHSPLVRSR